MKVSINNLGALNRGSFDLRPLTVFVGPNNTGKTWTAYTIAALFGQFSWDRLTTTLEEAGGLLPSMKKYPLLEKAGRDLAEKGSVRIPVVDLVRQVVPAYFDDVASRLAGWLPDYFASNMADFSGTGVEVDLTQEIPQAETKLGSMSLSRVIAGGKDRAILRARKPRNETEVIAFTERPTEEPADGATAALMRWGLARFLFEIAHRSVCQDIVFFPTERTTFITWPFRKIESPGADTGKPPSEKRGSELGTSHPELEFTGILNRVLRGEMRSNMNGSGPDAEGAEPSRVADILERNLLEGTVRFSGTPKDAVRRMLFRIQNARDMEISVASSMVKEIAPLVMYLRSLAWPGDWIVIDEPEMNLHPRAQVIMAEALAMLANSGFRIIITTHSPYIVDQLGNLALASRNANSDGIAEKFILKSKDAFLAKNDLAVYLFEKGTARNIMREDGTIDWGTFADTSDYLSRLCAEIS